MPVSIRSAHPDDAPALLRLLRHAIPSVIQPATPLGPWPAHIWIRDRIVDASQYASSGSGESGIPKPCNYRVAVIRNRIVGVAEWREISGALFLNSIAVTPVARGQGLGTQLLCDGIRSCHELHPVQLDVFESMTTVQDWYAKLGFAPTGRRLWIRFPPVDPNGMRSSGREEHVSESVIWQNEAEAATKHALHGCSMLRLQLKSEEDDPSAESNAHTVGRIGASIFRITDLQTLRNTAIRTFLHQLNPSRHLLYLSSPVSSSPPVLGSPPVDPLTGERGTHLATSVRMQHLSPDQICESGSAEDAAPTPIG